MRRQPSDVATSVSPVTHGLEALIRPEFGTGFQRLAMESNCSPGSPHSQAACEILRNNDLAGMEPITCPVVTALVVHS